MPERAKNKNGGGGGGGGGGEQAVKVERAKNELGGVDVYEECIGW